MVAGMVRKRSSRLRLSILILPLLRPANRVSALILTDPPVGDTIVVNNRRQRNWQRKWRSHPYGHGYVDFTPWDSEPVPFIRQDTAHGPPRSSALEDIAWYWTSVADAGQRASVLTDPIIGAIFLKRIVTSNWNVVLEFVWAKLSEFEREIGLLGVGSLGGLADILAEVHLFRRRISWVSENISILITTCSHMPVLRGSRTEHPKRRNSR